MGAIYNTLITEPLGWIIWAIYKLVQNYGLTILLFTVVVKILLMPLQIKSQKAMKKQQKIQPIVAELKKKYANDQQKMQQEMMKVYKENGVSMTGGCLPLLIQFPILFTLYHVIQRPLTYISRINFTDLGVAEQVKTVVEGITEKLPYGAEQLDKIFSNCQIQLSTWADKLGHADFGWHINFNFLGLDLSGVPSSGFNAIMRGDYSDMGTVLLVLIPIFAVLTTWYSMKQSQKMQGNNADDSQGGLGKSLNMLMPVMTGFFTFTFASGIGLYWIISSIMQIVQQYLLDKYLDKKEDDFVVKVPEKNRKNGKKRRRS